MAKNQLVVDNRIYKNSRFLITQPIIYSINGSTLVTLELAEFLQSQGAKVVVYTCVFGEPAKSVFKERGIKVLEPETAEELKLKDFDYIQVHSQILPLSIVRDLTKEHSASDLPRFIFLHMSRVDYLPDEFPWIPYLEERLCDKKLCLSEETKKAQSGFFDDTKIEFDFFRNPAPAAFRKLRKNKASQPRKILLVSNHPVDELRQALNVLGRERERGDSSSKLLAKVRSVTTLLPPKISSTLTSLSQLVRLCNIVSCPRRQFMFMTILVDRVI